MRESGFSSTFADLFIKLNSQEAESAVNNLYINDKIVFQGRKRGCK